GVPGVPDIAAPIFDEAMRPGMRRLERELFELTGLRIEPAAYIVHLSRVPDRAVRSREGIVRTRAGRRHRPHADRDLDRPRYRHAARLRLLREALDQIFRHTVELIGWKRHAVIEHHAHDGVPSLARVARPEPAEELVTIGADGRHGFLALAVG